MFEAILAVEAPAAPLPEAAVPVHAPERARSLFGSVEGVPDAGGPPPGGAELAPSGAAPPGFDAIGRRDLAARLRRRASWAVAAGIVEAGAVFGAGAVAAAVAAPVEEVRWVEVQLKPAFPRAAGRPRAPALPGAPAAVARARPPAGVRTVRPPPPSALLQPREVVAEMKAPAPGEPVEAWEAGDAVAGGAVGAADEGVIGGVAALAAREAAEAEVEDAPRWATDGFRKPAEAEPGCVARAVRLPPELAGFTSAITVRFAVLASGAVDRLEVLGDVPDRRIAAAVGRAVRGCRWRPGADVQGRPVAIWVVLPIRFESV
jgi:periplasmic protein TonB